MHVCVSVCVRVRVRVFVRVFMFVYVRLCVNICLYFVYPHMHTCTRVTPPLLHLEMELNIISPPRDGKKLLVLDIDYTIFDTKVM